MLQWLSSNLSTIVISLLLLAVVFLIVRYLIRQHKQGKHSCGGNCGACGGCAPGLDVTVCGKTYTGVCRCSRYITNPTERQCAFLRLMTELRRAYILETAVGTRQNLPPEK